MRARVTVLAIAVASGVVAACSGGATAPMVNESIGGAWHLAATIKDTLSGSPTTCTLTGAVSFAQTGVTFNGQLTGSTRSCAGPNPTTGSFDGAIGGGMVTGDTLTFRTSALQCVYQGAGATPTATTITGFTLCYLTTSNYPYYSGTFQLTR